MEARNYNSEILDLAKNIKVPSSHQLEQFKVLLTEINTLDAIDTSYQHHGWNALHWAAYNGNLAYVEAILSCEAGKKIIDEPTSSAYLFGFFGFTGKQTPLHLAINQGHLNVIKLLVKKGANFKIEDQLGNNPVNQYKCLSQSAADKNRVTLYFWHTNLMENRVGHVSLNIQCNGMEIHVSFWPEHADQEQSEKEIKLREAFSYRGLSYKGTSGDLAEDLDEDIKRERQPVYRKESDLGQPDEAIELYTLNTAAMIVGYLPYQREIKKNKIKWGLGGSLMFGDSKTLNCAMLVMTLLEIGGIEKLVPGFTKQFMNQLNSCMPGSKKLSPKTAGTDLLKKTVTSGITHLILNNEFTKQQSYQDAFNLFTFSMAYSADKLYFTPASVAKIARKAKKAEKIFVVQDELKQSQASEGTSEKESISSMNIRASKN